MHQDPYSEIEISPLLFIANFFSWDRNKKPLSANSPRNRCDKWLPRQKDRIGNSSTHTSTGSFRPSTGRQSPKNIGLTAPQWSLQDSLSCPVRPSPPPLSNAVFPEVAHPLFVQFIPERQRAQTQTQEKHPTFNVTSTTSSQSSPPLDRSSPRSEKRYIHPSMSVVSTLTSFVAR